MDPRLSSSPSPPHLRAPGPRTSLYAHRLPSDCRHCSQTVHTALRPTGSTHERPELRTSLARPPLTFCLDGDLVETLFLLLYTAPALLPCHRCSDHQQPTFLCLPAGCACPRRTLKNHAQERAPAKSCLRSSSASARTGTSPSGSSNRRPLPLALHMSLARPSLLFAQSPHPHFPR